MKILLSRSQKIEQVSKMVIILSLHGLDVVQAIRPQSYCSNQAGGILVCLVLRTLQVISSFKVHHNMIDKKAEGKSLQF